MDRLVSKIAAGGLSAGIFLLWWPEHVAGQGLEQLVLRGLLWTMTAELLLVFFGPLEDIATRALHARIDARRATVRSRLATVPPPARTGGAVALACLGLAAPLALLSGAPHHIAKPAPRPELVKEVIVKRPVIRRIVVRKVVGPAAADAQASAVQARPLARAIAGASRPTAAAPAATTHAASPRRTSRTAAAPRSAGTTKTTPAAPATSATPSATPTTPAPAATPAAGTAAPAPAPSGPAAQP